MRDLNTIIIHCSGTNENIDFGVKEIRDWHLNLGWDDIGYHFVIRVDGTIEKGRPIQQQGAHCYGHNEDSIGIAYIGGLRNGDYADTRTIPQVHALRGLVEGLKVAFDINEIHGHREYSKKACPCFDIKEL